MPVQYQCSNCGYPVSPGITACPSCRSPFQYTPEDSPFPNQGNRGDTTNYTPRGQFGDDAQRERFRTWGLNGGVGLGAPEFTWTEALGIFAFGIVAGIVGYKALEKAGKL